MSVILTAVPVGVAAGGAGTANCSIVITCLAKWLVLPEPPKSAFAVRVDERASHGVSDQDGARADGSGGRNPFALWQCRFAW